MLEWGDDGGAPFVVSGQAWGEAHLVLGRRCSTFLWAGAMSWHSISTLFIAI